MRTPCGGMAVRCCLAAAQAIASAERDPMRAVGALHSLRRAAIAARDARSGSEPEMGKAVVEDRVNRRCIKPDLLDGRNVFAVPKIPPMVRQIGRASCRHRV